jgi:MFS family permease
MVNAYGAWQSFYSVDLLHQHSSSAIAWIGSIQSVLLLGGGLVTGPIYDMGYFRALLLGGSGLIVVGMFTTSVATEYWQIMLSQGLCAGMGMAVGADTGGLQLRVFRISH